MATFWGTIGSNSYSAVRMQKLKRLKKLDTGEWFLSQLTLPLISMRSQTIT